MNDTPLANSNNSAGGTRAMDDSAAPDCSYPECNAAPCDDPSCVGNDLDHAPFTHCVNCPIHNKPAIVGNGTAGHGVQAMRDYDKLGDALTASVMLDCGEGAGVLDAQRSELLARVFARVSTLESELREARADSERLDWLQTEACKVDVVQIVDNRGGREGFSIFGMGGEEEPCVGLTLRDAIDNGLTIDAETNALLDKLRAEGQLGRIAPRVVAVNEGITQTEQYNAPAPESTGPVGSPPATPIGATPQEEAK